MYDGIFINPLFDSYSKTYDESEGFSSIQSSHGTTKIKYAGVDLSTKTKLNANGPTPLVSISKNFIQNDIGLTTAVEDTVTLDGYIVASGDNAAEGVSGLLSAASGLEAHLTTYSNGKLEIECGGSVVYQLDYARPTQIDLNKNSNAWTTYIEYSIVFVGINTGIMTASWAYPVRNTVDSWNIEPVQELGLFEKITMGSTSKVGSGDIIEYNFPRYKVTHRVAANGIRASGTNNLQQSNGEKMYWEALNGAKQWVSGRLSAITTANKSVKFDDTKENNKYNYVRSVNYDLTTAFYEVVDTWISMPSGCLFHEEYTIEASTNDKYQKTVRVNGTIHGMGGTNTAYGRGDKLIDSTGALHMSGIGGSQSQGVGENLLAPSTGNSTGWNSIAPADNRFENAEKAWHGTSNNGGGIKNLLYRRASAALNASSTYGSYTQQFNPSTYNRFSTVNNPINSKEGLLHPIPISTSETFDPKNGTISYNYEFNNTLSAITGAITEKVTINDTGPTDVVAEVFVLGRKLGPVLQNLGATTTTRREVSIELTVMPPTGFNGYFMTQSACPMFTGGSIYGLVQGMVSGLAPFGARDGNIFIGGGRQAVNDGQTFVARDDESWSPAEGRYSRNVAWIFQQCSNSKAWNDI